MILGIDEVGRGPWAGPLVVGAVVLGDVDIPGLTDSKKLTHKKRVELSQQIYENAKATSLGWVSASEIDEIGLSAALVLATKRAVLGIDTLYSQIIIDGTINFLKNTGKGEYATTLKKADLLIPAVSAASIIAKVARDAHMTEQDNLYPGYGFASHVGYGTAKHRSAIDLLGVTPLHRLSFGPLRQYRQVYRSTDTTKSIGDRAEAVVADRLTDFGHIIIERNWKTKYCEIDIVSTKGNKLYFTEVKYRKTSTFGNGLSAITNEKLKQMKFAANAYIVINNKQSMQPILQVASVSGLDFNIDEILDIV